MTGGAQGKAEIRGLLDTHGHRANKRLGQHFLVDPNVVDRIVRMARVGPGSRVVEVGAGTGTLTRALASSGAHVVAYEIDRHLEPLLRDVLEGTSVDLRFQDAAKTDLAASLGDGPWTLVANLPYNVGTPLVLDLLRSTPAIERFVVMVQAEVAERFTAGPGSRRYGLPSVIIGLRARVAGSFTVGAQVFFPAPDVDSAVVDLCRVDPPEAADAAERVAATAFGQRRKMLRRSLAPLHDDIETVLEGVGIAPTARPESLSPLDFVRIAEAMDAS